VFCSDGHLLGQPRSAISAATLQADCDKADDRGGDGKDDDHGKDDGSHDRCLSDSETRCVPGKELSCGFFYRPHGFVSAPSLRAFGLVTIRSPTPGGLVTVR
jgi:hypothetical protein